MVEEGVWADPKYSREQKLLMEIRDKLCAGNAAQLAREIGKDASYVNRLLYPEGKAGRKGIGLEIMQAVSRAFYLPLNFWEQEPPALSQADRHVIAFTRDLRNRVMHGEATDSERQKFFELEERRQRVPMRLPGWIQGAGGIASAAAFGSPTIGTAEGAEVAQRVAEALTGTYGTMREIHAWEFEEDLPAGQYALVPRLEVKLSAGPGTGAQQLSFDFDDGQLRAYSAEWIRQRHLKPNKLRVMKGSGDSMEPTIFDGDDLLINLAETDVQDGKVYALWYEGGERVKRLYRMPGGGLRIRSDNEREFPEIVLGPEYTGHVRIIGRVIDRSGPGGL